LRWARASVILCSWLGARPCGRALRRGLAPPLVPLGVFSWLLPWLPALPLLRPGPRLPGPRLRSPASRSGRAGPGPWPLSAPALLPPFSLRLSLPLPLLLAFARAAAPLPALVGLWCSPSGLSLWGCSCGSAFFLLPLFAAFGWLVFLSAWRCGLPAVFWLWPLCFRLRCSSLGLLVWPACGGCGLLVAGFWRARGGCGGGPFFPRRGGLWPCGLCWLWCSCARLVRAWLLACVFSGGALVAFSPVLPGGFVLGFPGLGVCSCGLASCPACSLVPAPARGPVPAFGSGGGSLAPGRGRGLSVSSRAVLARRAASRLVRAGRPVPPWLSRRVVASRPRLVVVAPRLPGF